MKLPESKINLIKVTLILILSLFLYFVAKTINENRSKEEFKINISKKDLILK